MSLIDGLLHQTIDYVYSTTKDIYNDLTRTLVYSNLPCRWQPKVERIVSISGEELTSTIQVWILPTYTIEEDYEIVNNSKTYKVAVKADKYDIDGNLDHVKLYLV